MRASRADPVCVASAARCNDSMTITSGLAGYCHADHAPVIQERAWTPTIWDTP
jgi:hypothetical protein